MKTLIIGLLTLGSISAFANCRNEARNIAEESMGLFNVNDQDMHCAAISGIKSFKSLPVIMVMPPRYSYEAVYSFPCGPQPKSPKVTMLLNERCKIVNLQVSGHKL
jgi:hypothetical protein